uniref:Aquaporin n=1 Tax=Chrysotila carterae TaxID=13221 RepID=A0A7S4B6R5_CHRCT
MCKLRLNCNHRVSCHQRHTPLLHKCVAEVVGTFFLVFFGTGINSVAIATGATSGIWQGAVCWGYGAALSVYLTAGVSGAHLNPAVSFSLLLFRRDEMPPKYFFPYVISQFFGALFAGIMVYANFGSSLEAKEDALGIERGDSESVETAAGFGEYYPDPAYPSIPQSAVSTAGAFWMQVFATGIMLMFVVGLTDERNPSRPTPGMIPFFIGMLISVLICLFAPYNQAGMNPWRDFCPRLVALWFGWGDIAIPGPRNGFWIYLLAPMIGAPLGVFAYDVLIRPAFPTEAEDLESTSKRERPPSGLWANDQTDIQRIVRELRQTDIGQLQSTLRGNSQMNGSIGPNVVSVAAMDSMA